MIAATVGAFGLAPTTRAQTLTTLYSFYCSPDKNNCGDGISPYASLMQATNGSLYGLAGMGGDNNNATDGGTVFKISLGGTFSPVFSLCDPSNDCPDGDIPQDALVQATNGALYGTTSDSGGGGTVFRMTPAGAATLLHTFRGGSDGSFPSGPLIQAVNGYLYGMTMYGGGSDNGIIYKLTPSGTLSILYNFCAETGCPDGNYPIGALVQASDANLYGATSGGGANKLGTIFKLTPGGTLTSLHSFCAQTNCVDGDQPNGSLIQAVDGNLYGTTAAGGANRNGGTVFKISPSGAFTLLYSFCAQAKCVDGATPFAGLIQATDGNLYGTTYHGGAHNQGTVFQITPSGTLTTLYSLCSETGCTDGEKLFAGLVQGTNGDLYGAAFGGGAHHGGTIFRLSMGLAPFVAALPAVGSVGQSVTLFGTNLKGTTAVTFNGTAATFSQASATAITATVPAGATTGTIQVTTPSGTLSSNVPFRVSQ